MNIIRVEWWRFQQCLDTFTILLVGVSSPTEFFRHLSDYVFGVPNLKKTKVMRVIFFSNCSKFIVDFKKAAKDWQKVFCFRDNCFWIGIVKLSLLRTGYFSSAANVLTSSNKIWHLNKRDFFQLNWLGNDQWIWKRCCDVDINSDWACVPCFSSKGPLKRKFFGFYLATFSETVISEIQKLWGPSFFSKHYKFQPHFKNAGKN